MIIRFRGRKVAASLKGRSQLGPLAQSSRFRGRKVAASLKDVVRLATLRARRRFRGRKVAASLKDWVRTRIDKPPVEIPRPKGRGLIEAE